MGSALVGTFTVAGARARRYGHVHLCLPHRHVSRDSRPDERRRRVERDEQHREPHQPHLPLTSWDSTRPGADRRRRVLRRARGARRRVAGGAARGARLPARARPRRRRLVSGGAREASRLRTPARESGAPARSVRASPPRRRRRGGAAVGRGGAGARRSWRPSATCSDALAKARRNFVGSRQGHLRQP